MHACADAQFYTDYDRALAKYMGPAGISLDLTLVSRFWAGKGTGEGGHCLGGFADACVAVTCTAERMPWPRCPQTSCRDPISAVPVQPLYGKSYSMRLSQCAAHACAPIVYCGAIAAASTR